MIVGFFIAICGAVSFLGCCLAIREFLRGKKVEKSAVPIDRAVIIAAGEPERPLHRAALQCLALAAPQSQLTYSIAGTPDDTSTQEALSKIEHLTSLVQGVFVPPQRHYPLAWLQVKAFENYAGADLYFLVDACARPSTTEAARLMTTICGAQAVGPCPVAGLGSTTKLQRLLGRLLAGLVPLMFAWLGPCGLLPTCLLLRRDAIRSAAQDPLSKNSLSLAHAALKRLKRASVLLLPRPLSTSCSTREYSLLHATRDHLAVLTKLHPIKTFLFAIGAGSVPLTLALYLVAPATLSLCVLVLVLVCRAMYAITWTATVQGKGYAITSFLFSPIGDLLAMAYIIGAMATKTLRSCGRLFHIRRGGVLVASGPNHKSDGA